MQFLQQHFQELLSNIKVKILIWPQIANLAIVIMITMLYVINNRVFSQIFYL